MQLRYDVAKPRNRATLLLACWFIGGFIFLTAAGSKLLTYSLPLFPPIAILAGVGFRRFFHSELATVPRWLFVNGFRSAAIFGIVGPIPALFILSKFLAAPSPPAAYAVAALASIAMAAGLVLFERQQGRQALAVGMLWFPLIFICLMTWPVQVLAELNSQRALAALLNASDSMPDEVVLMGQRVGSVLFYLSPDKRKSCENSRIREGLDNELKTLLPPPPGTMIAVTHKELKHNKRVAEMRALKPQVVGALNVVVGPPADPHVAERPERARE
jgi:4-amino-4-deoxy-L-arabinose transferase-like glycosyltransferase